MADVCGDLCLPDPFLEGGGVGIHDAGSGPVIMQSPNFFAKTFNPVSSNIKHVECC